MSKLNTALLFRSYIWLTETIYSAGYITRQEIDDKWARNTTLNHHNESHIPERTFHNWKNAIQDLFQIVIACDRSRGSAYYIENKDDLKHDDVRAWMLNTFAVTYEQTQLAYWRGGGFFADAQDDEMESYRFNSVFYHLAEHTCFALTDFIYVRDFEPSIDIHWGEQKSYSRLG